MTFKGQPPGSKARPLRRVDANGVA